MMESRVMISKSPDKFVKKKVKRKVKKRSKQQYFYNLLVNIEYNTKYVQFRGYILKIYISSYIT